MRLKFFSGYCSTLNEQQRNALNELNQMIDAEDEKYRKFIAERADSESDIFTLRFLRATMLQKSSKRIFQAKAALERLKSSIDFRLKFQDEVPNYLQVPKNSRLLRGFSKPADEMTQKETELVDYFGVKPNYRWNDPKTRSLVVIERFGVFGTKVHVDKFTEEQLELFTFLLLSQIEDDLFDQYKQNLIDGPEEDHVLKGFIGIVDLKGVSFSFLNKISFVQKLNTITGDHFPEMVQKYVFLHTPANFIVKPLLKAVEVFLDSTTVNKFDFGLGKRGLKDFLDSSLLPKEFGGDSDDIVPQSEV